MFPGHANRYHLGAVAPADVADELRTPLDATGHTMTDPALDVATAGPGGYPFLNRRISLRGFPHNNGIQPVDRVGLHL